MQCKPIQIDMLSILTLHYFTSEFLWEVWTELKTVDFVASHVHLALKRGKLLKKAPDHEGINLMYHDRSVHPINKWLFTGQVREDDSRRFHCMKLQVSIFLMKQVAAITSIYSLKWLTTIERRRSARTGL